MRQISIWICFLIYIIAVYGDAPLCEWTAEEEKVMMARLNKTMQTEKPDGGGTICSSTYGYGLNGYFQSPNYPNKYDNNLDCHSYIQLPPDYLINLYINFFSMQGGYDYLYIWQQRAGSWEDVAVLSGQYDNTLKYQCTNYIQLHFFINSLIRCLGVHLTWQATLRYSISPPKTSNCDGPDIIFLLDRSQVMFPNFYNNNVTSFVRNLLANFAFYDDTTPQNRFYSRFGVIEFSDTANATVKFGSWSRYNFLSWFEYVQYTNGGQSNVTAALEEAYNQFANYNGTRNARAIVLIVNDISMFRYNQTLAAMKKLKTVIDIPLGIVVPGIPGLPPDAQTHLGNLLGSPNYTFSSLDSALQNMPATIHQNLPCKNLAFCSGLVFIGEATTAIEWEGKLKFLQLVQRLASSTSMNSQQRFAVALYGVEIYQNIELQPFDKFNKTVSDLITNIQQYNMPDGGQTYLAPVLNQLYNTLKSNISASNYGVLVMGELVAIRDPSQANNAAQNVASLNADVYVLDESHASGSLGMWSTLTNHKPNHVFNGTTLSDPDDLFNAFQNTLLKDFQSMQC